MCRPSLPLLTVVGSPPSTMKAADAVSKTLKLRVSLPCRVVMPTRSICAAGTSSARVVPTCTLSTGATVTPTTSSAAVPTTVTVSFPASGFTARLAAAVNAIVCPVPASARLPACAPAGV